MIKQRMSRWNSSYYRKGNYSRVIKGSVDSIIHSVPFLPVEAEISPVFLESIDQHGESPENLAKFIALSPSLTFNLINLAQSSFYSYSKDISSLNDVLNILGHDISTHLIKDFIFRSAATRKTGIVKPNTGSDFFSSLKSAHLSALIADTVNYSSSFIAYVSSLLHNVGEVALLNRFPLQYSTLKSNIDINYSDQITAEEYSFGVNHCFLGARMVELWGSFPFISDAIFYHHHSLDKIKQASKLVKLVHFSTMAIARDEKDRSRLMETGRELFNFTDSQIDEYISIAELKVQNRLLHMGVELTDNTGEVIYQPGKPVEINYLDKAGSNSILSVLIEQVRKVTTKKELFSNIGRSLHILTGINEIYYFHNNVENKSLEGFSMSQIENTALSNDLIIKTNASDSIIVSSFLMGIDVNSLDRVSNIETSIFDLQICNYMGSDGLYCIPLVFEDRVLGVIVLGVNNAGKGVDKETIERLRHFVKAFIPSIADEEDQNHSGNSLTKNNKTDSIQTRKLLHEINNPLSAIKNYLKVLHMKLDGLDFEDKEIKIIDGELDRISKLLKEFRSPPTDNKVEKTSSSINSVISDTILLIKNSRVSGPEVDIDFNTDEYIPDIMIDKDAFRQVLINLINNAIEAMPMGGTVLVNLKYKSGFPQDNLNRIDSEEKIEISISDDGPGYPDNLKSSLFKKQATTKSDHDGLGLLIVYELVKKMGGTVVLDENYTNGACFKIILPAN